MKKIKRNKISFIISVLILFTIVFTNYSYASSYSEFNDSPRKYFTTSTDKLSDVTVRIEDGNGISSVELYSLDSKGENAKKIAFSTSNTKDNKKHIYTLSHQNLLKGASKWFYIKIKDNSGNIQYSKFKVNVKSKKENNKTIKYYVVDDSPRIRDWGISGNNVSFLVKDAGGTKYVKIQDANNSNKQIYQFTNLAKGDAKVTIDISKFKTSNDIYRLKIILEDNSKQQATRTVCFKANGITKTQTNTTTDTQTSTSTGTNVKKDKSVKSFVEALEIISKQVQQDYKAGKYWKYTNGVQSENKLPFKYTFSEALATNTRTTNCADFVMWGLNECGVLADNQKFYGNKSGGITYKNNSNTHVEATLKQNANIIRIGNKTTKQLISANKLKKGDICIYKGHTNVYAGNNKWFDAGRKYNINGYGKRTDYTFTTLGPVSGLKSNTVQYIIRLKK